MDKLIEQIKQARFIWIIGNGGSASTAEHFATDLIKKGYPAIALSANTSVITMIANDYGYEKIFSRQLEALAFNVYPNEHLLISISCSGTSKNILEALKLQEKLGFSVYKFETFEKGDRDFGKLENKHLEFAHSVAKALEDIS